MGTSTATRNPGSVLVNTTSSAVSASCGSRRAGLEGIKTELASWRRRALSAESRLAEVSGGEPVAGSRGREVEEENRLLAQRLQAAKGRLGELLDRLRFLEQQQGNGGSER